MSPLRFELLTMWRAKGVWIAFALACAPAVFALLVMAGMRRWPVNSQAMALLWWPSSFVFSTGAQVGFFTILQMYLLGDSLAGQAADRRLRALQLCPVSLGSLYLGKLAAGFLFAVAVFALSLALHFVAAVVAVGGTDGAQTLLDRGYHRMLPLLAVALLVGQAALVAFQGLVFSLAGSLKSGLLGVAGLTGALFAAQLAASRIPGDWEWLGRLTFTYHYAQGFGSELLRFGQVKLALDSTFATVVAALAADVIVFGALGFLAFRRREI